MSDREQNLRVNLDVRVRKTTLTRLADAIPPGARGRFVDRAILQALDQEAARLTLTNGEGDR